MKFFKEASIVSILLLSLLLIPFVVSSSIDSTKIFAQGTISYPNSQLCVDGTVIKDPSGNPVRLRGFNVEPRDMDEEGMQWLESRGFNSLRINFFWHRLEPREGRYDSTFLYRLDNLAGWCEKYGIYAILVFHQWQWSPYFTYYGSSGTGFPEWVIVGGGYPDSARGLRDCIADFFVNRGHGVFMRQKFVETWTFLVNRYKDNPYVWAYEIFNEPTIAKGVSHYSEVYGAVMDFYEEITETIRAIDSETTIVYHSIGHGAERQVPYGDIVWTKSWYDVAYEGYYPSTEYYELVSRLQDIKTKYNVAFGTPFIVSEMGFFTGTTNAEQWIRDTFDVMRAIGLNEEVESWNWFIYDKGYKYGYETPRNWDGSDGWIVSVLQEYA